MKISLISLLLFILTSTLHAQKTAPQKISLQLSWKHQFQFAGYYMAKEKGFYSDVGLDVELKEHNSSINVIHEVEEKRAEYGVGRSLLIVHRAQGKRLKMLFAALQSSPSVFIALKDTNISSIKDFKDKRIMMTEDIGVGASLEAMLTKHGLKIADMHRQKHSYNVESLLEGESDIMASYISNEPYLLRELATEFTIFNPGSEGFDFYSDVLFTSDDEIAEHPARVEAFVEASKKGWEYAFNHIDESVALIQRKYNTQAKSKEALLYEAQALKKLAYTQGTKLGEITKQKLQRIYDIYNVLGLIQAEFAVEDVLYSYEKRFFTPQEEAYLQEKKEITYCIDPDWIPYEKILDTEHIGMSADYVKLFEQRLATPMHLVFTEHWSESLEYLREGKCDLVTLASKTPTRQREFLFTSPYVDVTIVMATRLGIPFIDSFEDLKNKKIGITEGFGLIELFREQYPNFEIVEVKNTVDGLNRVIEGELFGYVGALADIGYLFQNRFTGELKISGKFNNRWSHGVALNKENEILFGIFEKIVQSLSFNEKQEIQNRWISIRYDEKEDYTYLWWTLGVLMSAFGGVILLLWEQKKINRIVQMQAARDYMTQLYNRRYFTDSSKHILDLARRNATQISVLMIDIDNFKKINDTYGHTVGDETIKALAEVMLQESRKSDMVARWGGEEFVILLPQTDIEGAKIIAEKIRKATEKLEMKTAAGGSYGFTISVGVSKIGIETDLNIEAAIVRADKALYDAKKSGKNRVCVNLDEVWI